MRRSLIRQRAEYGQITIYDEELIKYGGYGGASVILELVRQKGLIDLGDLEDYYLTYDIDPVVMSRTLTWRRLPHDNFLP